MVVDKKAIEELAHRLAPEMRLKAHGPAVVPHQPDVQVVHFDCWSTTNLTWFDKEMELTKGDAVEIIRERTKKALADLGEMWFESSHHLLDPEFLIATSPSLRRYISDCVKEGYFPHEEHGCSTPIAKTT